LPRPDDAADALAVALTHAFSYKLTDKVKWNHDCIFIGETKSFGDR
jgi:hypothetical protein